MKTLKYLFLFSLIFITATAITFVMGNLGTVNKASAITYPDGISKLPNGEYFVTPSGTHPTDTLRIQWVIDNTDEPNLVINLDEGTFMLGNAADTKPYPPGYPEPSSLVDFKYRHNDGTIFIHGDDRTITLKGQVDENNLDPNGNPTPTTIFERGYSVVTVGVKPTFYRFVGCLPEDILNEDVQDEIEAIRFGWAPDYFVDVRPVYSTDVPYPGGTILGYVTENYKYHIDMQGTVYNALEEGYADPNYDSKYQGDPVHAPPAPDGGLPAEAYVVKVDMATPRVKLNMEGVELHNPGGNAIWVGAGNGVTVKNCHFVDGRGYDASVWRFRGASGNPGASDPHGPLTLYLQAMAVALRTRQEPAIYEGPPGYVELISGTISFTDNYADSRCRITNDPSDIDATYYKPYIRDNDPPEGDVVYYRGSEITVCNCHSAAGTDFSNNWVEDSRLPFLFACYPHPRFRPQDNGDPSYGHKVEHNMLTSDTGLNLGGIILQFFYDIPDAPVLINDNDLIFSGPAPVALPIMVDGSHNAQITNNRITMNSGGVYPILGTGIKNSLIEGNTITGRAGQAGMLFVPQADEFSPMPTPYTLCENNTIRGNNLSGLTANLWQILMQGVLYNTIEDNDLGPTGPTQNPQGGVGIACIGAGNNIKENRIPSSFAVHAVLQGNNNTLDTNTFGNALAMQAMVIGTGNKLLGNTLGSSQYGINYVGQMGQIIGNIFVGNYQEGISLIGSNVNTVRNNDFSGATITPGPLGDGLDREGASIALYDIPRVPCSGNTVTGNIIGPLNLPDPHDWGTGIGLYGGLTSSNSIALNDYAQSDLAGWLVSSQGIVRSGSVFLDGNARLNTVNESSFSAGSVCTQVLDLSYPPGSNTILGLDTCNIKKYEHLADMVQKFYDHEARKQAIEDRKAAHDAWLELGEPPYGGGWPSPDYPPPGWPEGEPWPPVAP